jgi:dihydrofolate reductase
VESRDADVPARPWDRCSTSMATETSYWEYAGTAPFSFVDDVAKAIAAAREFVGDRDVDVATGQIGSQALKLGLIDQVVLNVVPVVFGSGRPFFATGTLPEPLELENPTTIVPGDRVTHLAFDVRR